MSIRRLFIFVALNLAFTLQTAKAAQAELINGVDVQPLTAFLSQSIRTLKKPIKIYHWFEAEPGSIFSGPIRPDAPEGYQYVVRGSQRYWKEYGKGLRDNSYGLGLYLALDPVVTAKYGGDQWVLTEVQLEPGFRFFDIANASSTSSMPAEALQVLKNLKCDQLTNANSLFQVGPETDPACIGALQTIFRDRLAVQGLNYNYAATYFSACLSSENSSIRSAMVLFDSKGILPNDVQIYNSQTREAKLERIRIQSLFFQADVDSPELKPSNSSPGGLGWVYVNSIVMKQEPGYQFSSVQQDCSAQPCKKVMEICPLPTSTDHSCKRIPEIKIPILTYPEKISGNPGPINFHKRGIPRGLLWSDLEGEKTDSNLSQWIQSNVLGCSPGQF